MSLADMGLSRSVIESAARGIYTPKQLDKLVTQKRRLQDLVAKQEQQYQEQKQKQQQQLQQQKQKQRQKSKKQQVVSSSTNSSSHISRRSSSCTKRHSSHCTQDSKTSLLANNGDACDFQCCHACRPIYRDRIYQSVDAVFADEVEPFHPSEIASLHVSDARLICGIGFAKKATEKDLVAPLINGMDRNVKAAKSKGTTATSALNSEDSLPSITGSRSSSGTGTGTDSGTGISSNSSSDLQVLEPVPIPMSPRASLDEACNQKPTRKKRSKPRRSSAIRNNLSSPSPSSRPSSRSSTAIRSQQKTKTTVRLSLKKGLSQLVAGSKANVSKRSSKDAEPGFLSSVEHANGSKASSNRTNSRMVRKRNTQSTNVSFLPSSVVAEAVNAVSKSGPIKIAATGTKATPSTMHGRRNGITGNKSSISNKGINLAKDASIGRDDTGLVEVVGGLALTEEAVEMSLPDVTVQG